MFGEPEVPQRLEPQLSRREEHVEVRERAPPRLGGLTVGPLLSLALFMNMS
jgi:hypothetical protein